MSSPLLFVVNSASPYRTLSDLIAAARANPAELTLASTGPATTRHIGFEQFKRVVMSISLTSPIRAARLWWMRCLGHT